MYKTVKMLLLYVNFLFALYVYMYALDAESVRSVKPKRLEAVGVPSESRALLRASRVSTLRRSIERSV